MQLYPTLVGDGDSESYFLTLCKYTGVVEQKNPYFFIISWHLLKIKMRQQFFLARNLLKN